MEAFGWENTSSSRDWMNNREGSAIYICLEQVLESESVVKTRS